MKKNLAVLFLFAIAGPLFALEDSPENRLREAERYLAAAPPQQLMDDTAEQVAATVPGEKREAFKNILTKYLDVAALSKTMKEAMVKDFTADELKALADFYGSPVGKSAMKKFGTYMADIMPAVQAELMKAMTKAPQENSDDAK